MKPSNAELTAWCNQLIGFSTALVNYAPEIDRPRLLRILEQASKAVNP